VSSADSDLHDHGRGPAQTLVDTEQHIGTHNPAPARRPNDEQWHREPREPAGNEERLAADPVGELPREEVGERFDDAKADKEGKDGGLRHEPKVRLGDEWDDGALEPHHRSDEGIDDDEQRELTPVGAEAEPDGRRPLRQRRSDWRLPPARWGH